MEIVLTIHCNVSKTHVRKIANGSLQNNDKAHGSAYELPMRLYLVDSYTLVP